MPIHIDNLQVTVRVKTKPRARLAHAEARLAPQRTPQRVQLLAPPKPHAATPQADVSLASEEQRQEVAWKAADVDVEDLANRVYDYMRFDIRISRERSGGG